MDYFTSHHKLFPLFYDLMVNFYWNSRNAVPATLDICDSQTMFTLNVLRVACFLNI